MLLHPIKQLQMSRASEFSGETYSAPKKTPNAPKEYHSTVM